jgi:hypothetical protein
MVPFMSGSTRSLKAEMNPKVSFAIFHGNRKERKGHKGFGSLSGV